MGQAVGYLNAAVNQFQAALVYVKPIGGTYMQNFEKKLAEAVALRDKAHKENTSVYYDTVPTEASLEKPNAKNYVKLVDCSADLNAQTELDNHLRHLVPPAVRQMQQELKQVCESIVQSEASKDRQLEEQLSGFLKTFGLPEALTSATASTELPEEVWKKIEEF